MGNSNPSTVEISFPNKLWIGEIAIQKSINKKKNSRQMVAKLKVKNEQLKLKDKNN